MPPSQATRLSMSRIQTSQNLCVVGWWNAAALADPLTKRGARLNQLDLQRCRFQPSGKGANDSGDTLAERCAPLADAAGQALRRRFSHQRLNTVAGVYL